MLVGREDARVLHAWLLAEFPRWAQSQICRAARYLGVVLGPGHTDESYVGPLKRFTAAVADIRKAQLGLVRSIASYNMLASSKLGFVAAFFPPPVAALRVVREGLQRITAGPRFALA